MGLSKIKTNSDGGRRRLEASSTFAKSDRGEKENKWTDGKRASEENERQSEREAEEVSSGCQPGGSASGRNHGSTTGRYGNQKGKK